MSEGIKQLEKVTNLINTIQLFSSNESLDEVTSVDIKYLLTPALLAFLSEKSLRHDRIHCLDAAQVYYNDFLKRLQDYGIIPSRSDEEEDEEIEGVRREPDLRDVARSRQNKIERYRRKKEMDSQIQSLKNHGEEEELIRKYHLLLLRKWAETAVEELDALKMEVNLLKSAGKSEPVRRKDQKPREAFKPFIITRNEIEKRVFGLGYPSVPAMTVDEFVDQKEKDGTWAFSNKNM